MLRKRSWREISSAASRRPPLTPAPFGSGSTLPSAAPPRETAVIGLLLLAEPWQRRGIGRAFATLVEQAIAAWPEILRLRLGVVESNPGALAFWRKLAYRETGEVKPAGPDFLRQVIVLEKPLARARAFGT